MEYQYHRHGIFCLEGRWESNLKDNSSVLPLLQLLKARGICDYIHHDCATTEEFEFFLGKWKQAGYKKKFPILYLGFHGQEGVLHVDERRGKKPYSIVKLAELLKESGDNSIIYFASCSTLGCHKKMINTFLAKTRFLAALGYHYEVHWIKSAALDLLILDALQVDKFDNQGLKKINDYLENNVGKLDKHLDLRFVKNETTYSPRKRKKKVNV